MYKAPNISLLHTQKKLQKLEDTSINPLLFADDLTFFSLSQKELSGEFSDFENRGAGGVYY